MNKDKKISNPTMQPKDKKAREITKFRNNSKSTIAETSYKPVSTASHKS